MNTQLNLPEYGAAQKIAPLVIASRRLVPGKFGREYRGDDISA